MSPELKAIAPKLTKLLLLLLGSDQDNEALTARSKLKRLLQDNGLDSHGLVATLLAPKSETRRLTSNVRHVDMRDGDRSTVQAPVIYALQNVPRRPVKMA
jgi:hypothetical protein